MAWTTCIDLSVGIKVAPSRQSAELGVPSEWLDEARAQPTNIVDMIELVESPAVAAACARLGIDADDLLPKTVYHFTGATSTVDNVAKLHAQAFEERRIELPHRRCMRRRRAGRRRGR